MAWSVAVPGDRFWLKMRPFPLDKVFVPVDGRPGPIDVHGN
jgi:hypothetical protein